MFVPYGCTVHGQEEIDAVVNCLKTSTQMGKNVREMESRVAELYDKKYGIMVNSGSSANYLSIELLNLPKGSEIITPALTFSTTVAPIVKNGLIPVFIDVEEGTYNIDVNKVESMITSKTKAMMIPNLLGNLPNWRKLKDIADKYNLITIEDSCDTLGAEIDGASSGRFVDISVTSFYGSHVINCAGNGGMLCVNDKKLNAKAKLLRSWGRSSSLFVESEAIENRFNIDIEGIRYDAKFVFEALGYNLEPSEMGAAFGLVQLSKLHKNIDARNKWFNKQIEFFKKYEDWFILPKTLENCRTGWLAFPLTVREKAPFTRTDMQIFLEKCNIQTRTVFTGNILRQPGFRDIPHIACDGGYPNSDAVMKGGILLACHHGLTQVMMDYVHTNTTKFLEQYK
ncbi:aminotransferase class I/II-fold pyridoxal phosphate-dependent enzyme [Allofrancisella frigidaquae]|uniref:Aminotransferase class I/II-fold pyridoxal phosphate-dependent enzyme n=2 Tax=Allofrancisella frigidaquae TaxID=1085644 RepID=A0A6M3I0A4_9GAMM|nr:aminotransferase class I/II-fold pyridoxal phosphate-dependent enzyme [Allofrancisella frigidaquae]